MPLIKSARQLMAQVTSVLTGQINLDQKADQQDLQQVSQQQASQADTLAAVQAAQQNAASVIQQVAASVTSQADAIAALLNTQSGDASKADVQQLAALLDAQNQALALLRAAQAATQQTDTDQQAAIATNTKATATNAGAIAALQAAVAALPTSAGQTILFELVKGTLGTDKSVKIAATKAFKSVPVILPVESWKGYQMVAPYVAPSPAATAKEFTAKAMISNGTLLLNTSIWGDAPAGTEVNFFLIGA